MLTDSLFGMGNVKVQISKILFLFFLIIFFLFLFFLTALKSWEQDLRSKSKIFATYKENTNVSDDQQLLRKSVSFDEKRTFYDNNRNLQSKDKRIIFNESVEKRTVAIDLTQDRVSKSESAEIVIENKLDSTQNKNQFYNKKAHESYVRHANPASIPVSIDKKLNELPSASLSEVTDFVANPNDLKDRTLNKSESQNTVKKKLKTSQTKPSRLFRQTSEHFSNLNLKEDVKTSTPAKKSKDKKDIEASQAGKKSKKSKAKSKTQMSPDKEDKKKKIKQDYAIQSLKSLMEAYINVNEVMIISYKYLLVQ